MATNPQTLRLAGLSRPFAWAKAGFKLVTTGLLAAFLCGCARDPEPLPQHFVGAWKSSRLNSRPLHMLANGDWEIRSEDAVKPLQYGVWQLKGRTMLWTFRSNGETVHDKNRIESFGAGKFVLREQDGSLTSFARLN